MSAHTQPSDEKQMLPGESAPPRVSLIIATHNRQESLHRGLAALARQTCQAGEMEVVVVLDGCGDGTLAMLRGLVMPYALRWIEQDNQGAAAARNHGVQQARGDWLIFLDDDIEAHPGLVTAHCAVLSRGPEWVSLGYLPTQLEHEPGYFQAELRGWWEAMFEGMRSAAHRFRYTDLLTGNFALSRALFERAGGFNTQLRCHEDYELGAALLEQRAQFAFTPAACGIHHEKTTLERSLRRKTEEGIADVQIGRLHPELRPTLLMSDLLQYALPPSRIMMLLAFNWPALGDNLARLGQGALTLIESLRRYATWKRMLYLILGYWYWRGVRQELPTLAAVRAFLAETDASARPATPLPLDIKQGLPACQRLLDETRPESARVYYGPQHIGDIPAQPGREPLAGRHLPGLLTTTLYGPLMAILAEDNAFGSVTVSARLLKTLSTFGMGRKR